MWGFLHARSCPVHLVRAGCGAVSWLYAVALLDWNCRGSRRSPGGIAERIRMVATGGAISARTSTDKQIQTNKYRQANTDG